MRLLAGAVTFAIGLVGVLGVASVVGGGGCGSDELLYLDGGVDAAHGDGSPLDASACAGLDLATCRRTAGCTPNLCPGCGCSVGYLGCLSPGEPPAQCPALGCDSGECCRDSSMCQAGTCASPGEIVCGGACNPEEDTCARDADCQTTAGGVGGVPVCEPIPCSCNGAHHCVPGCASDENCDQGETCTPATGRCAPSACDAATPCPPDFDCTGGACLRRACADDLVCDHFCVDGACRDTLGDCQPLVP
ncbi:MAG TPA: hypothetical protein VHE35_31415 [Kofleriaceae bacterium]|nr:hypothetical protein [Kofleriaceae bacterium]